MSIPGRVVLVTGGSGSFGKKFIEILLKEFSPQKVIVFSRDEYKQHQMITQGFDDDRMRYFIGDVRDKDRLYRALDGVDIVVHAAAVKQVPACEYNPIEAIKTNIMGAANLIDASIDTGVEKVIALSTDKAAAPVNLYGATKLCSDKLFVAGNNYSRIDRAKFSVVRYGNVMGSRGSVIPLFMEKAKTGCLPITDERMTRFWLTLEQGARFVLHCLDLMEGGEIFVPKIPSMSIMDLAKAIGGPQCKTETLGIRPGEKIHEVLIPEDDARHTLEYPEKFVILPAFIPRIKEAYRNKNGGEPCREGFVYSSDNNSHWLGVEELRRILDLDAGEDEVPESPTAEKRLAR